MMLYKEKILNEFKKWQKQMLAKPSLLNSVAKKMQAKINTWIPEKIHKAITATIRQMVRAILFGAKYTTKDPVKEDDIEMMEVRVNERIILPQYCSIGRGYNRSRRDFIRAGGFSFIDGY